MSTTNISNNHSGERLIGKGVPTFLLYHGHSPELLNFPHFTLFSRLSQKAELLASQDW